MMKTTGDSYSGYLTAYVPQIRELHGTGATVRQIAEAIFAAGARAQTSEPIQLDMSRDHHVANLALMVLYVLRRLGLRSPRRVRVLRLKAERDASSEKGALAWSRERPSDSDDPLPAGRNHEQTP
jgi:hypothetical protein